MTAPVLPPDEAAALKAGERAWPGIIAAAREDPAIFAALILRDEATAARVIMDPPHVDMQDAMTEHARCLFTAPQRSGKSTQLYARIIWELGHDHSHRVLVACNTHQNASKAVQLIGRLIKGSEDVHAVFPDLLPSTPWGETQLTVKRRGWIRDPSVRAVGVGTEITGGRVTWCLLDDTITPENCATVAGRQKTVDWYNGNVLGRLDPGTHVVGVANCIHEDDMFHRFAKTGVWFCRRYPVFTSDGELAFPTRWTHAAIAERKAEYGASSPYDYERFMLCRARDDATAVVKQEWIDICLQRGQGLDLVPRLDNPPDDVTVFHGMDQAFSGKGDLNALVTLARYPTGILLPLNVESGHWPFPEKRRRIVAAHARYGGIVIIEGKDSAQKSLVENLNEDHPEIPVRGFDFTAATKRGAVDRLCAKLAMGHLPLPNRNGKMAPELEALVREMRGFDPSQHTGDRMIGLLLAMIGAANMGPPSRDIEVMFV